MSTNKNKTTNTKNPTSGRNSANESDKNCYVNLNQTYSGQRLSYDNSDRGSTKNQPAKQPLTVNNVNKLPQSKNISNHSRNSGPKSPKNWYSPPSSVQSDSRPPSMAGIKTPTHKGLKKLQTIDENAPILPIDKVMDLCKNSDVEIQLNALAYLQHLIFNNNDKKMEVRNCNGLRTIIELTRIQNSKIICAALNVLKNLSFTDTEVIITDIERLTGIQRMISIIENNNDVSQKEIAIDILWNLSVHYVLKNIILTETVKTLMECVILPECKLVKQPNGDYVPLPEPINWSIILRNCLGIIRNISYESTEARIKLRDENLLIDCITYLISMAKEVEDTDDNIEKVSLIDSKIIENCTCILRNLTYAIQEVLDPNYLQTRQSSSPSLKSSNKGKGNKPNIISPPHNDNPKGVELLWNSKHIVETINPILKYGANAVTLEAAAGIIQNLSAGDWEPSQELRTEFRVQLALPSLIELVDIAPDEVIRSASTSLRNLVLDEKTCMLIGSNGLHILVEKIPMHAKSKKITNPALGAVLSTIYAVIKNQEEFMKEFINQKGVQRCIYVRDSEDFVSYDDQYPDKIAQFCKQILELLWKTPGARELLKQKHYKQSDIMPTRNMDPCNMCTPSKSTKPKPDKFDSLDLAGDNRSLRNYQENNKFNRDSCSTMVSNAALQQRNSRAYTTNVVPGYGQVKVSAKINSKNNNKFNSIDTISEKSDNLPRSQPYIYNNINSKPRTNTGNQIAYYSPARGSGSHNSYTNNSYVGSQDDLSKNWPNRHIAKNSNRPPPDITHQRNSQISNISNEYNYEYSFPVKPNKPSNTLNKQEKVDSWV